ncbi:MAG: hypothetical protein L0H26_10475, partial [Microlunatus sp.]|nr:hypothetical protein [Microlunatus sp.]
TSDNERFASVAVPYMNHTNMYRLVCEEFGDQLRAVFEALEVFPSPVLDAWYGLYTTGERRFYDALVGA